jgi:hypothetical protein
LWMNEGFCGFFQMTGRSTNLPRSLPKYIIVITRL